MAKMIPPVLYEDCSSPGEKDLFFRLKKDPQAEHWTVVHSLCVADHPTQQSGEIDFIVMVPGLGVLCLEVKASRKVKLENGLWWYGKNQKSERRGPFRQVSFCMHKVREDLKNKFSSLSGVLFWSAVVFTHCRFGQRSPEWHPWQIIDSVRYESGPISHLIRSVLKDARRFAEERNFPWFNPHSCLPTLQQCTQMAEVLRPTYEPLETPADRRRILDRELRQCTEEQIRLMKRCRAAKRIIVQGPASTGKTYMAIAVADRDLAEARIKMLQEGGKSVFRFRILFLCYNRLLCEWLREELGALAPHVSVKTMDRYMMDVCGMESPPIDADEGFWKEKLPTAAVELLLEKESDSDLYDALIIDEAQDLLRPSYRDVLELSLKGGLTEGCWRVFGDFSRQNIYTSDLEEAQKVLDSLQENGFPITLTENCRNTPVIADLATLLGGLDPPYERVLRPDDGRSYQLRFYRDEQEQQDLLGELLDTFIEEGFGDREITVLSMKGGACSWFRPPENACTVKI